MRPVVVLAVAMLLLGCVGQQRNPVPLERLVDAEVVGMTGVRAWGAGLNSDLQADLLASVQAEAPGDYPLDENGVPVYAALALSGGGANGAFGAGFLKGWTEAGSRPRFKLVTGISTGALTAPMAFLGEEYDAALEDFYTEVRSKDIYRMRPAGDSFASSAPLYELISSLVTEALLAEVARAHERGRRLLIGTTNMDAQQLVIWNMGAIAGSGHPDAVEVFRKVMLASASIPAAFPPVMFDVEVDGEIFDEMHVDGGTVSQVFLHSALVDLKSAREQRYGAGVPSSSSIYLIRNGMLMAEPKVVPRKLFPITSRALDTLIKAAGRGDMLRIYALAERDGIPIRAVSIPADYESEAEEVFDQGEMSRLFEIGYQQALSEQPWEDRPPGFR